ncbi:MAG: hypothetical protein ABFS37_11590, partial [Acidobacteriota bacterium]
MRVCFAAMNNDPLHDLELLIRSRYGALLLDTLEEDRAEALAGRAAERMQAALFVWRRATGLRRVGGRVGVSDGAYGTQDPRKALAHVIDSELPGLYVFHGLGTDLQRPEVADLVREAAQRLAPRSGSV